jgi:hypothetical protein
MRTSAILATAKTATATTTYSASLRSRSRSICVGFAATSSSGKTTTTTRRRRKSTRFKGCVWETRALLSEEENQTQIASCKKYVSDLTQMNMKLPLIRRYVAGAKNDLKLLQSFQDMLAEKSLQEENEDEEKRREKVLMMLNDLRLDKAEEEQFWLERGEDRVTSSLTDNAVGLTEDDKVEVSRMLATGTMFAVQGAVWNAILLLLTVAGILLFVGRGDVNVATPGATGAIGY